MSNCCNSEAIWDAKLLQGSLLNWGEKKPLERTVKLRMTTTWEMSELRNWKRPFAQISICKGMRDKWGNQKSSSEECLFIQPFFGGERALNQGELHSSSEQGSGKDE